MKSWEIQYCFFPLHVIVGYFNYESYSYIWSNILERALERINVLISLQYNETGEPELQSLIDQSFLSA